jgi:hypothetical protein
MNPGTNWIVAMLIKVRGLLREARDVRYVSVPFWRPWRDF